MRKHAVYANCTDASGERFSFRVGLPVPWDAAIQRWYRLDDRRRNGREFRIRRNRRWYRVDSFEARAVDRHGRGLGSDRHAEAAILTYRELIA